MGPRSNKNVLFLGTPPWLAVRSAEAVFNSVAAKLGLPWTAVSRALAIDETAVKAGKLPPAVTSALQALGLRVSAELSQPLPPLTTADLEQAGWIVALNETVHRPLLDERFPAWAAKVECWSIDDSPQGLALIQREVMDLASRLLRGGQPRQPPAEELCPQCHQSLDRCSCPAEPEAPSRANAVRVGRETKGRRGKGVTIISDLPLDEQRLEELAARLKQRLGTGGTIKDGRIEIQGDQRDRIVQELERLGYRVRRAGG